MPTTQPHCCETNKWEGKRYNKLFLNCRFCKKKIFVECLRRRDELRTKELLIVFGLMTKTTETDGSYKWEVLPENPNKTAAFNQMFNVDSPFGIICEACVLKFTTQQGNLDGNVSR